jgi:hypothetical protein
MLRRGIYQPMVLRSDDEPQANSGGRPMLELTGERYGVLLVTGPAARPRTGPYRTQSWWSVRCDCGRVLTLPGAAAKAGRTVCRCLSTRKNARRVHP